MHYALFKALDRIFFNRMQKWKNENRWMIPLDEIKSSKETVYTKKILRTYCPSSAQWMLGLN